MFTKTISSGLGIAAFILVAAVSLRYAQGAEIIDAETAKRAIQGIIGLVLAVYGNYMPKAFGGYRGSACAVSRTLSALRVGGWAMTLAGLTHAALWVFAPVAFAHVAAMAVVGTATLLTVGYGGWVVLGCRKLQG